MDKRCFASFSIGSKKYYNIVYRYVVSMDVFQLLLDKPWQYDKNIVHDLRSI